MTTSKKTYPRELYRYPGPYEMDPKLQRLLEISLDRINVLKKSAFTNWKFTNKFIGFSSYLASEKCCPDLHAEYKKADSLLKQIRIKISYN